MDVNNVIRITANEKEYIYTLLQRMLDTKKEKNTDIECVYKTGILSTIGCNNFDDMCVANSSAIFLEIENLRKSYLATDVMKDVINKFKSRGKKYDGSETNREVIAADIYEKEKVFEEKLTKLNSIDFNNTGDVRNWVNSIVEYVNNHDLNLPLGINNIEYGSMANYIVRKLEEKGYTSLPNNVVVNNFDDFWRRIIAYQLEDLSNYGFFAYNYAENLVANDIITDEIISQTEDNEMLTYNEGIGSYKVNYKVFKNAFDTALATGNQWVDFAAFNIDNGQYEKYSVRTNEASVFEERLLNTKKDDNETKSEIPSIDYLAEYTKANEKLNSILRQPGRYNDIENKPMQLYSSACSNPNIDNIIKALEAAYNLPVGNEIKEPLIDAIVKLNNRYIERRSIEELQILSDKFNEFGIVLENKNSQEQDIQMSNSVDNNETKSEIDEVTLQQYTNALNDTYSELQKEALQTEISKKKKQLTIVQKLMVGEMDATGKKIDGYQIRKDKIKSRIVELEQSISEIPVVNYLAEYTQANEKLNMIVYRPGRISSEIENKAMQLYTKAYSRPLDVNNIINAMEAAYNLPVGNEIKEPLVDAIVKLNNRYIEQRSIEELQLLSNKFNSFGITLGTKTNIDLEIQKLNDEYASIEKGEQEAKDKYTPKIAEIEKEIKELENKLNNIIVSGNENTTVNSDNNNNPNTTTTGDNSTIDDDYDTRLSKLVQEGPLFVDRDRIKQEDQWMETRTAQSLGKLDTSDISKNASPSVEEQQSGIDNDIPEVSEGFKPQIIKNIKKASNKLLEKVYSGSFKEKIGKALEWMKQHKAAVIAGVSTLVIGTTMALNAMLGVDTEKVVNPTAGTVQEVDQNEYNTENVLDTSDVVTEDQNVSADIESIEISDEDLLRQSVQATLNDIVEDKADVYSSAENAANDINAMSTNQSQRENSWAPSTPGAFFDSDAQILTREQAEQVIANGGQVIARLDNNGTPIGYVPITPVENNSGITK